MTTRGWTCERLALALGVSMTTVWKWRSGARPAFEYIHKIRKLTRGKVKEEDWPPVGSRAHAMQGRAPLTARIIEAADELLGRD